MRHDPVPSPLTRALADPRLGTRGAWKVIEPFTKRMHAAEKRHGHMSSQCARRMGDVNALNSEDHRRRLHAYLNGEVKHMGQDLPAVGGE